MTESGFLTDLKHSFQEQVPGVFWHKLMDMPHFKGQATRFDTPKPFDLFMKWQGCEAIAIVGKYMRGYQAFGKRHLRPSQLIGLEHWQKAGGHSYIFLNIVTDKKKQGDRMNRLMVFDWHSFRKLRVSITKKELLQLPYIECYKKRYTLTDTITRMEMGI